MKKETKKKKQGKETRKKKMRANDLLHAENVYILGLICINFLRKYITQYSQEYIK
jgi:hypothetical protein